MGVDVLRSKLAQTRPPRSLHRVMTLSGERESADDFDGLSDDEGLVTAMREHGIDESELAADVSVALTHDGCGCGGECCDS